MAEINAFPSEWRRGVYEVIARRRDIRSFNRLRKNPAKDDCGEG